MNTLQKILDFFNTPTNQKMNVICIAGIVCTVISLIDKVRMLVFTVYGCWGYWGWMFEELLFDGLPRLLALTAMLLTFLYWKRGNRFPLQPAVPILLLIENLISLLSVFFRKNTVFKCILDDIQRCNVRFPDILPVFLLYCHDQVRFSPDRPDHCGSCTAPDSGRLDRSVFLRYPTCF